jgi:hypothetical protein
MPALEPVGEGRSALVVCPRKQPDSLSLELGLSINAQVWLVDGVDGRLLSIVALGLLDVHRVGVMG